MCQFVLMTYSTLNTLLGGGDTSNTACFTSVDYSWVRKTSLTGPTLKISCVRKLGSELSSRRVTLSLRHTSILCSSLYICSLSSKTVKKKIWMVH